MFLLKNQPEVIFDKIKSHMILFYQPEVIFDKIKSYVIFTPK